MTWKRCGAAGEGPKGGEKKKLVARQRRKEGLAGGWREKEREGESRGRTRACSSSSSRLPGRGEWMDRSHFSDENTASGVRNRVPTLVPPQTVGRLVWTTTHESKVLCRANKRARQGRTP